MQSGARGKSEFLEQDLIPAAQKAGYLTTCLNLGDAQALKRLQDQELITRIDVGEHRFQDEAFAEWVKNRGLDG